MLRREVYYTEVEPTNVKVGDVWLRTKTGGTGSIQYAIKTETDWDSFDNWGADTTVDIPEDGVVELLYLDDNKSIGYDNLDGDNTPGIRFESYYDYVVKMNSKGYFNLFKRGINGGWEKRELLIPGMTPIVPMNADGKNVNNYSGFKEETKNPIWLYIAVLCLVLGVTGTMMTFVPSKTKSNVTPK
jgi:hypothetical protein